MKSSLGRSLGCVASLAVVVGLMGPITLLAQAAATSVPMQGPIMTLPDGTRVQGSGTIQGGIVGGLVTAPPQGPNGPPQRQLRTGTSRISGRVTSNGQPLRMAIVTVSAPELNGAKTMETDQDGRFDVKDLPAGRYNVSVRKTNYISLSYGQTRPNDIARPLQIADGQQAANIDFVLPRGGVIAGRVLDEYGDPVSGAQVTALQKRMSQGQLRLQPVGGSGSSNDIGEFRIAGLSPGQYYVSSTLRSNMPTNIESPVRIGYAPTYYPGTTLPSSAQQVTVGLGETVAGIEMQLQTTMLASISGSTLDSQGATLTRGSVSAILRDGSTSGSSGSSIRADGTFVINGVAPGEYLLRAVVPPPPPPAPGVNLQDAQAVAAARMAALTETLMAIVTVNGSDVSGVVLTPMKRVTISGHITFDGSSANVRSSMIQVTLAPRSPEASMVMQPPPNRAVRDDFSVEFVAPAAEVMIRAAINTPLWVVKAVRVNGVDITDVGLDLRAGRDVDGLEIALTSRPQEVSGSVTDGRGEPQMVPVLIFPQDRERWIFDSRLIATARPDQTGRYRIRTLPPGRYLAAVIDGSVVSSAFQDPDVLESLRPRATAFTLAEGEVKTVDLKIAPGR